MHIKKQITKKKKQNIQTQSGFLNTDWLRAATFAVMDNYIQINMYEDGKKGKERKKQNEQTNRQCDLDFCGIALGCAICFSFLLSLI